MPQESQTSVLRSESREAMHSSHSLTCLDGTAICSSLLVDGRQQHRERLVLISGIIQIINLRQAAFKNADDLPDTAAGGEQF